MSAQPSKPNGKRRHDPHDSSSTARPSDNLVGCHPDLGLYDVSSLSSGVHATRSLTLHHRSRAITLGGATPQANIPHRPSSTGFACTGFACRNYRDPIGAKS